MVSEKDIASGKRTGTGWLASNKDAYVRAVVLGDFAKQNTKPINRVLVVGCGAGDDARALAEVFNCRVDCIDFDDYFKSDGNPLVHFQQMDATALKFADREFDLVYSFHALEHIPAYKTALSEMRRVLKSDGIYCIGTPNRTRIVGYIAVSKYTLGDKIRANLKDWSFRLRGRFRNEYGAHAGFSIAELLDCGAIIGPGRDVSLPYYHALYPGYRRTLDTIAALKLDTIVWPGVYVVGRKVAEN
ncbi:MAG: class I SAM-dependent methyltransferase [Rhizomicrobium sp.]